MMLGAVDATMCAFTATASLLLEHGSTPCLIADKAINLPDYYHHGKHLVQVTVYPWVILSPQERQVVFAERLSDFLRHTVPVSQKRRVAVDVTIHLSLKYLHDLLLMTGVTFPELVVYM